MNFMKFDNALKIAVIGGALALGAGGTAAFASTISVSYLAPGVQDPSAITPNYETFNTPGSIVGGAFVTTFNGSGITGTYSGDDYQAPADQYNGAGGTGSYNDVDTQGTYTLTLSTGVNYFGYYLGALDAGNQLQLFDGNTLVYTFTPQDLINALGTCDGSGSNPYCGNPHSPYTGDNNRQLYAYVNFYDSGATFDKIVFTETIPDAGYESDNHAVAILTTPPGGTPLNPVPEPSSLVLLGTGVLGIAGAMRRKLLS
jgi:hypothetical protein